MFLADVHGPTAHAVVRAHGSAHLTALALDASDKVSLEEHLAAHPVDAVISSLPYYCNVGVAEAARAAGAHYFDLTEDVEVTRAVVGIAAGATAGFRAAVRACARVHQHRRERTHESL